MTRGNLLEKSEAEDFAGSTMEAEYYLLYSATCEALWLRKTLQGFMPNVVQTPTTIFQDNQGCIALATNGKQNSRTKHIDVTSPLKIWSPTFLPSHFLENALRS